MTEGTDPVREAMTTFSATTCPWARYSQTGHGRLDRPYRTLPEDSRRARYRLVGDHLMPASRETVKAGTEQHDRPIQEGHQADQESRETATRHFQTSDSRGVEGWNLWSGLLSLRRRSSS